MLPAAANLKLALRGGVLRVTLNRPEARNAMNAAMVAELCAVVEFAATAGVRVLVLRGAGGHFCAGADLKEVMAGGPEAVQPGAVDPIERASRSFGGMLRNITQCPAVVITVCEGSVLGGGFGLACVSDVAYAHKATNFGLPETRRGLPPAQIAPFIVERIGLTQARKLCLTGAQFSGIEALRLGLVHEIFSREAQLQEQLDTVIAQVLACAPQANAMTKNLLLKVGCEDMDHVLDEAAKQFAAAARGNEAREGIAAYLQKRSARWG